MADPSRRRRLDSLNTRSGQSLRELCAGLDMARQSVSKHLAVLESGQSRPHRPARSGEAALPQRCSHQRDRRTLDQPLRPTAGPRPVGPEEHSRRTTRWKSSSSSMRPTSTHTGSVCGSAALRLCGSAAADRTGLHPSLLGTYHPVGLERGIKGDLGAERCDGRPSSPIAGSPIPGTPLRRSRLKPMDSTTSSSPKWPPRGDRR